MAHARVCLEVHIGAGRLQDLMAPLAIAVRDLRYVQDFLGLGIRIYATT